MYKHQALLFQIGVKKVQNIHILSWNNRNWKWFGNTKLKWLVTRWHLFLRKTLFCKLMLGSSFPHNKISCSQQQCSFETFETITASCMITIGSDIIRIVKFQREWVALGPSNNIVKWMHDWQTSCFIAIFLLFLMFLWVQRTPPFTSHTSKLLET